MTHHDQQYDMLRRSVGRLHGPIAQRLLDDAYAIAVRVHAGEYRASGDPYITHPLAVAHLITQWHQPLESICAALLHDVPDSPRHLTWMREIVGDEVADLVEQSYALNPTGIPTDFTATHPLRAAAVIKLADRLHNARTWRFIPKARARSKAHQTLSVYAPAAALLGLRQVAEELQALAATTLDDRTERPASAEDLPTETLLEDRDMFVTGVAGRLFSRAILALPPHKRHRYLEEWTAELLALTNTRARLAMAGGLYYSAIRLRNRHRQPRPVSTLTTT